MKFNSVEDLVKHLIARYEDMMKRAEARGDAVWDRKQELNGIKKDFESYFPVPEVTPPSDDQEEMVVVDVEEIIQEGEESDKSKSSNRRKRST